MRINNHYIYRKICEQPVLIPSCSDNTIGAAIYLNGTANEIYCYLKDGKNPEEIISALLNDYEADEAIIRRDVESSIRRFLESKVLLEDEV